MKRFVALLLAFSVGSAFQVSSWDQLSLGTLGVVGFNNIGHLRGCWLFRCCNCLEGSQPAWVAAPGIAFIE